MVKDGITRRKFPGTDMKTLIGSKDGMMTAYLCQKYDFIISKNLGGIGIWALGYDDGYDQLWNALGEKIGAKSPPSTPEAITVSNLGAWRSY